MKKIYFIFVLFMFVSITNANNKESINNNSFENKENLVEFTEIIKTVINEDFTCSEYHAVYYDGVLVAEFTAQLTDGDPGCNGIVHHYLKKVE